MDDIGKEIVREISKKWGLIGNRIMVVYQSL